MPGLDTRQVFRGLRALMLLGLGIETIYTIKYPWHSEQQEDAYFLPAWRLNAIIGNASERAETQELVHPRHFDDHGSPIYSSTKLLQRCHSAMQYNITSMQYETGPMSVWSSASSILSSDPAAAWATWQEIIITARNPWAAHWACLIVPDTWHIMPQRMRKNLELLEAAVPVLVPDPPTAEPHKSADRPSSSREAEVLSEEQESHNINDSTSMSAANVSNIPPDSSRGDEADASEHLVKEQKELDAAAAWWDSTADAQLAVALTRKAMGLDLINNSSASSSHPLAGDAGNSSVVSGDDEDEEEDFSHTVRSRWVAHCSSAVNHTTLKPSDTAFCTVIERGNASNIGGNFTVQRGSDKVRGGRSGATGLFGVGPMARSWHNWLVRLHIIRPSDRQSSGTQGLAVSLAAAVWNLLVPTSSVKVLSGLLRHVAILELEYEWEVLMVYVIVVLVVFRNWLYLVCVAYKVSRHLGLLALHGAWDRLTGTLLTLLGAVMRLWQNMGYAVLDLTLDVLLIKLSVSVLEHSYHAAFWAWSLSFEWGVFEMRAMFRCWKLAKEAWSDVKNLVMDPQAVAINQPLVLANHPKNNVAAVGPWPGPLNIPEEVDDLPNANIPRGFICPITQAIMRQPALLLHDQTVTPSSYEKEAIAEWLTSHSTDPKTPGRKLHMKSVKLVYNGDLARAIEDWVGQTMQQLTAQRRQFSFMEQRLQQITARAQEAFFQRRQQQQAEAGAAPADDPAAEQEYDAAAAQAELAGSSGGTGAAVAGGNGNYRGNGTATNLMRQSSAALATVASLDIPTVATAGFAAIADTTRRMTTRAAARRLAQQQQQHEAAASGNPSEQLHADTIDGLGSPFSLPEAAGISTAAPGLSRADRPDSAAADGTEVPSLVLGDGSSSDSRGSQRTLRARRRTPVPASD